MVRDHDEVRYCPHRQHAKDELSTIDYLGRHLHRRYLLESKPSRLTLRGRPEEKKGKSEHQASSPESLLISG
jgi:hypothetical protein